MTRIIPRSEWGARPARGRTTVAGSRRRTFVLHYDDARPTTRTGRSVPQAIQRYHMDSNGWSDIGYNFVIDQAGNIFEGRGWDVLGAHAGAGGNAEGVGVQIHIGGSQEPSPEAVASAEWLWRQANGRFGRTLTLKGHQNYMATSCPGGALMRIVRNGFPKKTAPPAQTPAPMPPMTDPLEDTVPDHRETRTDVVLKHSKDGGEPDWTLPDDAATVVLPKKNPQRGTVLAHLTFPDDATVYARFVSWDNKNKRWNRPYPTQKHVGGTGETSLILSQASGDADLRLDVRADRPCTVGVYQSALTWEMKK